MSNFFDTILFEPFERFLERLVQFLPDILTGALIFLAGIVLGLILKSLLLRFFNAVNLDRFSERFGMVEMLKKGGVKEPFSLILSRLFGWILIISFSIISLRSLNIPAIDQILQKFILYLPNIFVAFLILFLGYLLSNFLGRAALIAAVNAGLALSGSIGKFVRLTIFLLAVTMALEQLGIGKETIVIAFSIVFGGVVLALAIAFGLGGKELAKTYLEKKLQGREKKDEINHL
ncbi:MAG: mechanosensitive ion channel family protein [Nitrospirota bacterium]